LSTETEFDLQTFLPYLLNEAAETQSLAFQPTYKGRYGMLRTEWRVLFHLGRHGGMTATELCQKARLHKTKVSRAVHGLEEKRFLTRTENTQDRRQATLTLTRRGANAFADLTPRAKAFEAKLCEGMSDTELQLLRDLLLRLGARQDQQ